jgi:hypothetical protein
MIRLPGIVILLEERSDGPQSTSQSTFESWIVDWNCVAIFPDATIILVDVHMSPSLNSLG